MRITLIVGLQGSGKTTFADSLVQKSGGIVIDDISLDTENKISLRGEHLIITDPNACCSTPEKVKQKLQEWFGPHILEVFAFSNDVEQCWSNVQRRNDGRKITRVSMVALAQRYRPDDWGTVIPVWRD